MSREFPCPCGRKFKNLNGLGIHSRSCAKCSPDDRLWAGIDKDWPGGCWQWMGARQRDGYAHFTRDGKTLSLHRYLYEKLVGPIPEGLDLLHSCDNRACVYPGHMMPGTHLENMHDAMRKRRHTFGARNKHAILDDDKVRQIRAEYRGIRRGRRTDASNSKELADRFGVSLAVIHAVVARRTWRHIP